MKIRDVPLYLVWLGARYVPRFKPARPPATCRHEAIVVAFDEEAARGLSVAERQHRWPRFEGTCFECGTRLIKYASAMHYVMGDW